MIFAAILAGGVGSRMNVSDVPKQFLTLGDKPIVIHTLEKFLLCKRFDKIYMGVHPDWVFHMRDLIKSHNLDAERIEVVAGGTDRNKTLFNVISEIKEKFGDDEENIIVTHDAVRPFVTLRMIEDNIDMAMSCGACDTVVKSVDTIVMSEDSKFISNIPNREFMYQGQTPQSFKINLLCRLYEDISDDEKKTLTDACKICAVRNTPVKLVQGDVSNLKITTISDYKIAQAMVGGVQID